MFLKLKSVLNIVKKIFLIIAVYVIIISLFSYFIGRDKISLSSKVDSIEKNRAEIYKVINDKKLNSTKEGKLTIVFYRNAMCSIIGEACTDNPKDADKNYEKSVFGFITKLIVLPYANPPASGVYWAYSGLQSAGFIPKTHAAEGIGFAAIKPFSTLWKIFRDLSYMFLVLVLIAIGFMVMFRMKMNPQTVISVENALPKIIVSLILITFSFAIAGFLIDLMYLSIALIVSILSSQIPNTNYADLVNKYLSSSFWQLWLRDIRLGLPITQSIADIFTDAFYKLLPLEIETVLRTVTGGLAMLILQGILNAITTSIGTSVQGAGNFISIPGAILLYIGVFILGFLGFFKPIIWLLFFFSIIFLLFRIFLILFMSYLKLIISIIISPFLLLFESLGKEALKYWIMNLIGNLIPFPITIAIFLISRITYILVSTSSYTISFPYINEIESRGLAFLISLGLIFLIPDFIKLVKELLGIKELPISIGVGTYFGGVSQGVGGLTSGLGQFGSIALAMQYIPFARKFMESIGMKEKTTPPADGGAKPNDQ